MWTPSHSQETDSIQLRLESSRAPVDVFFAVTRRIVDGEYTRDRRSRRRFTTAEYAIWRELEGEKHEDEREEESP